MLLSLAIVLLLSFVVLFIAGGSLQRKGRWSASAFRGWLLGWGLVCVAIIALFAIRARSR